MIVILFLREVNTMSHGDNERDDFWDLDKIVPKKKPVPTTFATTQKTTVHTIEGKDDGKKEERKLSFDNMPSKSRSEEFTYYPESAGLIRSITIKRFVDKYDFYGNFRKAALIYYDYKQPKCDFASFYSYMPQYTQFNAQQKSYYFYWRDEVRHGRYIQSDYSYVYLLAYEILNLPDKIPPEEGIKLLCKLWREYRESLPRIDAYFSQWIQDYCFVHNLPCPMPEIRDFVFDVVASSDFKEFYLSDLKSAGDDGVEAMIAYLSDYDWRKGKFAEDDNPDNIRIYRNHMLGAMRMLIGELCGDFSDLSTAETAKLTRDAFPHSLCTHAVKCKLTIEYVPLSSDEKLRTAVTAGVRYTENKLRAFFGVKSRLGIKDLPDEAKRILDYYFDSIFEMERIRKERDLAPEYENLYNAEKKALSFADADEIERASWTTTARLVDGSEEYAEDEEDVTITVDKPLPEESVTATATVDAGDDSRRFGLNDEDIALIRRELESADAEIDDMAFERINEAFANNFDDIILEHDGERYVIIEDYRDDIAAWLDEVAPQ